MHIPHPLLLPKGSRVLLLGNEAIARGALESGVGFVSAYPGTPSTEIVEAVSEVAEEIGVLVEWSTNEKVAYETAYAAAIAGVRSLVAMKHVGVNVAADILMSSAYAGVNAGFVLVSADDPGQHSSQNEQDNRWYGFLAHIPVIEPWNPRSAYKLVKEAFKLSEKYKHPVMLRSTTRISHSRQPIEYEYDVMKPRTKGSFDRDIRRYVLVPAHGRRLKRIMMDKWRRISEEEYGKHFIEVLNPGHKRAIIASGIAYSYVSEALEYMGLSNKITVVRVSLPVPLPRKPIVELAKDASEILVVEELDPIVETQVKKIVHEVGANTLVYGKEFVPVNGELNLEIVYRAIKMFLGETPEEAPWSPVEPIETKPPIPLRPPVLCPGCPHRITYYIVKTAAAKAGLRNPIFTGDIGCYTLGFLKPFETQHTSFEMGGSIGVAHGLSKTVEDPVIAVIGDSTFYHAGIPGSINIIYNKGRAVILVLDNMYTAMTGHQPHPGTGMDAVGKPAPRIPAEDILRAIGYETYVINPMDIDASMSKVVEAFKRFMEGANVAIVSRMKCALQAVRKARRMGIRLPAYGIDESLCKRCMACVKLTACPAIVVEDGRPRILEELCVGCGLCAYVCPYNAIKIVREGSPNWIEAWR